MLVWWETWSLQGPLVLHWVSWSLCQGQHWFHPVKSREKWVYTSVNHIICREYLCLKFHVYVLYFYSITFGYSKLVNIHLYCHGMLMSGWYIILRSQRVNQQSLQIKSQKWDFLLLSGFHVGYLLVKRWACYCIDYNLSPCLVWFHQHTYILSINQVWKESLFFVVITLNKPT